MTANLERMLQPGETVTFRAQGRSMARIWLSGSTIMISSIAFVMLLGSTDLQSLLDVSWLFPTLAIVAVTLVGCAFLVPEWLRQRQCPDEILITDRRILFADSDWDDKSEAMALNEVKRISWSASGAAGASDVIGADRTLHLPIMREPDAIARALGRAAEKPHPRPVGPLAFVDLSLLAMVLTFASPYLALTTWFETMGYLPPEGFRPWEAGPTAWTCVGTAFGTAVVFTFLLGEMPGKLLNATAMRFFATPEQMAAGLCAGQANSWRIRIALKWAGVLYGQPLSYAPSGPKPPRPSNPVS